MKRKTPTYPIEPPPWRRTNPAGERTRSPRWRAGSRRTKRLRNVPSREREYPPGWVRFYHCEGTFSHAEPPRAPIAAETRA